MATRTTEIRVGLAVVLAIVLLVAGVTWLSELGVARARVRYYGLFPNVGGLQEGDPVTMSGVRTGRVEEIGFARGGVLVELSVDRAAPIPVGSGVYVRNTGIIGEKFIAIEAAQAAEHYAAGDTIVGVYESGVPEVISQMGDALTSLNRASEQIDRILSLAEERGTVRTALENVERASTDLSQAISENREDLRATVQNLKEVSSRLRSLAERKETTVEGTIDRLANTAERTDTLITNVSELTAELARIADRLQSDSTTAGRVLTDRELYDDFRRTLRELSALLRDVRANPRKYFKVSLF
jgi:phospholipid/cholesterol/gamma-HCH transport system substrate-binding protein